MFARGFGDINLYISVYMLQHDFGDINLHITLYMSLVYFGEAQFIYNYIQGGSIKNTPPEKNEISRQSVEFFNSKFQVL
jgi:hypothetical protein